MWIALHITVHGNCASPELYHRASFHGGDVHISPLVLGPNKMQEIGYLA
jgi:hypothetical protein